MFVLTIFVIFVFIILLLLYKERYSRYGKLINKIPGPKSWPIVGNSLNSGLPPEKLFPYLLSLHRDYGPINQIHGIGASIVHVNNPEDIEKLISPPKNMTKSVVYKFLIPWLGDGLLNSTGNKWHQRRKLLTKAFHFQQLKKYMIVLGEESQRFLKEVEKETAKQETDVLPLLGTSMLRIMCETSMGISLHEGSESVLNTYLKAILTVGECFAKRFGNGWLYFDEIFKHSKLAKVQNKALQFIHGFTNNVINERRKSLNDSKIISQVNDEKFTMLDLLLENEKSGGIDHEGINEEVDTFMFAGHDTTATALSFILMAIANEPQVQDKIYEEMRSIFGDSKRPPTFKDINEMKYLECCIKESLRLYPSAVHFSRQLPEEIVLGGYTIPANTMIQIHVFYLHRRADLYPEPERFIPERFLPENSIKRHSYAYIPFSAGPRNCIGQKFAMMEMKTVLSSLIRNFRLEPVTKVSDLVFKSDIILRTVDPILVRFRTRVS